MWETYNDIQYRHFDKLTISEPPTSFSENKEKKRLKVVLDGQQRLQSLYISLYGKYQGKYLYFDVLSGRASDNFEEEKYSFEFMTDLEAEKRNSDTRMLVSGKEQDELRYFLKVSDTQDIIFDRQRDIGQ